MGQRLVDLSHVVAHGRETYPGLPAPVISEHLSREDSRSHYAPGTEFHIGRIEMVANTGTYLDAPFHRYADGDDLAALRLEQLADLPGVVVDAPRAARCIDVASLPGGDLRGHALLFRTGWSRHFGTPRYNTGHPFLSGALAEATGRARCRAGRHRLAQHRRHRGAASAPSTPRCCAPAFRSSST